MPYLSTIDRALRRLVTLGLMVVLAACGSGGSDSTDGAGGGVGTAPPGALTVRVTDAFGAAVAGALVSATLGTSTVTGGTDANGVALLLIRWPSGTAGVGVTRESFLDATVDTPIVGGAANEVAVTLQRATAPAGGFLATRSGVDPVVTNAGQRLSFEVELIVVDGNAGAIETLTAADFTLLPCTPDPATDRPDCLRGGTAVADTAYAAVSASPEVLDRIPGGTPQPYAAGLLLDQSGSIARTDPTGARLFSAKALLQGLGADDRILLAAFASGGALIPTQPLTVYPPFRDRSTAADYLPTLDRLGPLVGGDTPLYAAIGLMQQQVVTDPSLPSGMARAVVVFTDGADTTCASDDACAAARNLAIQEARAQQVRLFTIGLSDGVDVEALTDLAARTGGAMLYAESAEQLLPLYGSLGRLLSLSLSTYRLRWTVDAATAGAFQPGAKLLGRVKVRAPGREIEVPIIVGVS